MTGLKVRIAVPDDAAAVAAIYAPHVDTGYASFEVQSPSASDMVARIRDISAVYPWLVAERDGIVLGFAYASKHRERAAYQWSVDVAVYVAVQALRQGIGRQLYAELFKLLKKQGFYNAYAGITLPNPASVGLHEAMGFGLVGIYRNVGFKAGAWRDVGWWHLALQQHPPEPRSPTPFSELGHSSWA